MEKEIELEPENVVIYSGGGAVNSVNGYTGDVVLTTSDLENTSDYQTGTEVESAISTAIAGKQDTLTAGNNITISDNTISATDTTYSAGTGLDLTGTTFSVDTDTIATKQSVTDEATARENADINLQGQIDAISASSDVTDIVGTYAELEAYDTTHLKDNDIIKVLQDESQNDETTYYRWSTTTETFTLIGEEGPYYTKSQTDTLLSAKQDTLTAGSNISISAQNEISATDTTYSAGSGLDLTGTTFSVDTTTIQPKLTAGSNITIDANNEISATDTTYTAGTNVSISSGNVISATDTTYSNFVGTDGTAAGTAGLVPGPATTDAGKFLKADGTWDTVGSAINVVQTTGTSQTDVMSQNATTSMVFADPATQQKIKIGAGTSSSEGANGVEIGRNANALAGSSVALGAYSYISASNPQSVCLGALTEAKGAYSVALGAGAVTNEQGEVNIGTAQSLNHGYNSSNYRLLTGLYDGQSAHDAATKGQLDSIAIKNAGAPTTATVGTVGQLLEDTTNGKLYICTAIVPGTDPDPDTYTWTEVGAGGSGPTVVQTTGTSTTDVMSQNAVTSMVFADPATMEKIKIGAGTSSSEGSNGIEIGHNAAASGFASVACGYGTQASAPNGTAIGSSAVANSTNGATAIGAQSSASGINSIAISGGWQGAYAEAVGAINIGGGGGTRSVTGQGAISLGIFAPANSVQGKIEVGSTNTSYGYNSSNYRLLTGLYDPQSAHDAATKGYCDNAIINGGTTAPTTSTVGAVGTLYAYVTSGTGHLAICTDDTGGTYTWQTLV